MTTIQQKLFIGRTIRTLNWRLAADRGEMIEQRKDGLQYCKDHLSHPGSISQEDLDSICDVVNDVFGRCDSDLRVGNNMGEFIPTNRVEPAPRIVTTCLDGVRRSFGNITDALEAAGLDEFPGN